MSLEWNTKDLRGATDDYYDLKWHIEQGRTVTIVEDITGIRYTVSPLLTGEIWVYQEYFGEGQPEWEVEYASWDEFVENSELIEGVQPAGR